MFKNKLLVGLLALTFLSPLGIILPHLFHAEGAWGEESIEEIRKDTGFVPEGMKKKVSIWKAPLPNYGNSTENKSILSGSLYYILSGLLATGLIALVTWWLYKIYQNHE